MYILEIEKILEKLDDELNFKDEKIKKIYKLDIKESEDEIEIITVQEKEEDEDSFYDNVEKIFQKIKLSKTTFEILNIEEIIKKWHETKKKTIFNKRDKATISVLMELTRFYENEDVLSRLIKTYLHIPFLITYYRYKNLNEREFKEKILNVFTNDKVDFIFELTEDEENNEVILKGNIDPNYQIVDYQIELEKLLEIPNSTIFSPKIEINGKYKDINHLEEMKIEIAIDSNECMKYRKTFRIMEEKC